MSNDILIPQGSPVPSAATSPHAQEKMAGQHAKEKALREELSGPEGEEVTLPQEQG